MKLSKPQQHLHWALWKQAKAKLMPGRETWTKHEKNEARHAVYIQALGEDKSLTEMDNDDFDKVKGALLAIIEPGNLNAQLHAQAGQRKRLLYGIGRLAASMGVDEAYVQGIIDRMDARRGAPARADADDWERERERSGRPQRALTDLSPRDLAKVMIALREHERRGMVHGEGEGAKPDFGTAMAQEQRDRRRQHAHVGGRPF